MGLATAELAETAPTSPQRANSPINATSNPTQTEVWKITHTGECQMTRGLNKLYGIFVCLFVSPSCLERGL